MTDQMKKSLQFVTRFYTPGILHPDSSFIMKDIPFWKRHAVAASIIGTALVATAAVTTYFALNPADSKYEIPAKEVVQEAPIDTIQETPEAEEVKKMVFEDAELSDVVKAIEKEYGVKIEGSTDGQPRLTLSYHGTAEDLVATINDLLGTNLTITKK